jgi:hypothetical protein
MDSEIPTGAERNDDVATLEQTTDGRGRIASAEAGRPELERRFSFDRGDVPTDAAHHSACVTRATALEETA